jgi:hypothetical protein
LKNNKNPELAGKLKEVIKQVSHSKKWPRFKDEKGRWVNSYSLLQDRFFEHMRAAGFTDFERGERGSTAEHLTVLEYKTQREQERAAALAEKTDKKRKQLEALEKKTAVAKQEAATITEIEGMVKPALLGGNLQISPADWKKVSGLAKEGVKSRGIIAGLKNTLETLKKEILRLKQKLIGYEGKGFTDEMKYFRALSRAPRRLMETVSSILREPPERKEQERPAPERKKDRGVTI